MKVTMPSWCSQEQLFTLSFAVLCVISTKFFVSARACPEVPGLNQ
jgi:hypothetical protein